MCSLGIIMNGVTGRMGANQHLKRSLVALRREGGVVLKDGTRVMPEPVLVGRDAEKLKALAEECEIGEWTTDVDSCWARQDLPIYFDAQTTSRRADAVITALNAGKHVYCEKPLSADLDQALEIAKLARIKGLKNGIVQDKLFLPGLRKLKQLIDSGFFGRILSVRGEFGYWVFEGDPIPAQRPSWNYRKEDGGGITLDMFGHWQYVLSGIFGPVKALSTRYATHIPSRHDEEGRPYQCTADDAVYATFELENGVIVQLNSSWAVRVYRDDLFTLQVDGTEGSAIAGLRDCRIQSRGETPRAIWNPDLPVAFNYFDSWHQVTNGHSYDNAFKVQWESFLRHVLEDEPFPHDFLEAARGVQLAELGLRSSEESRWLTVPALTLD